MPCCRGRWRAPSIRPMNRRSFLGALLAAPAIVRAESLMPVRRPIVVPELTMAELLGMRNASIERQALKLMAGRIGQIETFTLMTSPLGGGPLTVRRHERLRVR